MDFGRNKVDGAALPMATSPSSRISARPPPTPSQDNALQDNGLGNNQAIRREKYTALLTRDGVGVSLGVSIHILITKYSRRQNLNPVSLGEISCTKV